MIKLFTQEVPVHGPGKIHYHIVLCRVAISADGQIYFTIKISGSKLFAFDGITGKVIVNGREFDAGQFYKVFNLRAPGAIHLKSGLFNIEKK